MGNNTKMSLCQWCSFHWCACYFTWQYLSHRAQMSKRNLEQNTTQASTKWLVSLPPLLDKMFPLCRKDRVTLPVSLPSISVCLEVELPASSITGLCPNIIMILARSLFMCPYPYQLCSLACSPSSCSAHNSLSLFCATQLHMHPSFPLHTFPIFPG